MPVRRCGSAALSPRLAGEGADGASRLDGLGDGAQWRSHLGTLGIPLLTIIYIDRNNDSDRGANRRQCNLLKMRVHACMRTTSPIVPPLAGWLDMCCTSVTVLVARALRTGMRRGSNLSADILCGDLHARSCQQLRGELGQGDGRRRLRT